jgi:hypothetical protein
MGGLDILPKAICVPTRGKSRIIPASWHEHALITALFSRFDMINQKKVSFFFFS